MVSPGGRSLVMGAEPCLCRCPWACVSTMCARVHTQVQSSVVIMSTGPALGRAPATSRYLETRVTSHGPSRVCAPLPSAVRGDTVTSPAGAMWGGWSSAWEVWALAVACRKGTGCGIAFSLVGQTRGGQSRSPGARGLCRSVWFDHCSLAVW